MKDSALLCAPVQVYDEWKDFSRANWLFCPPYRGRELPPFPWGPREDFLGTNSFPFVLQRIFPAVSAPHSFYAYMWMCTFMDVHIHFCGVGKLPVELERV